MGLEHLLQIGKARIAEGLREPHQGRGLHAGFAGDAGYGAQRDGGRMLPKMDRDLAQLLREPGGSRRQHRAQLLVTAGPRVAERRADAGVRNRIGALDGPAAIHR